MQKVFDSGEVRFNVNKLHGCCGCAVISGVTFAPIPTSTTEALYDSFREYLRNPPDADYRVNGDNEITRCKILMADSVRGPGVPSLYNFGIHVEAYFGEPTPNPKSGNQLVIFEFDRV
jgi:hypothetical protein